MNDELFDYIVSLGANLLCGVGGIALGVWIMKGPLRPKPPIVDDPCTPDELASYHASHVRTCRVCDMPLRQGEALDTRCALELYSNRPPSSHPTEDGE